MLPSVKHALRVLRKDPGFTAVAICSMAIGIGATAAMFSFADAILLRPLPIPEPDRVVAINTVKSAHFGGNSMISYPDYADLRDRNRTFDGLVAASYTRVGFSGDARTQPRMKFACFVSGNFFRVLGVQPSLGRTFRADEDQAEGRDAVVILGHDFWVSQYNASPSILGSRMRLNGIEFTIVGVAPEHFTGIDLVMRPPIYIPFAMSPRLGVKNTLHDREGSGLFVKGRLKPGVGIDRARADIEALGAALQKLHGQANSDLRLTAETELQLRVEQGPEVTGMSIMLGTLGLCVLLVACANVAGLLLSRARARSREIAVRLAIGAGRGALIRQLLLENLLVAIAGGAGGIAIADLMAAYWRSIPIPTDIPVVFNIGVDNRLLLFTFAVSVLSTLLFGLAPAIRVTRPNLVPALKASGADSVGRRLWGRNLIVSGQVALSLILLAVAASLIQGFHHELAQGPGFQIDRILLTSFDTQLARYSDAQTGRFFDDLLQKTRSASGVRSAALVSNAPMAGFDNIDIVVEGFEPPRGKKAPAELGSYVSDGYFETMGVPILAGRGFLESDRLNAPLVAVVNQHAAEHYWPAGDAIGKRFHLTSPTGPLVQIVGIARSSKVIWIAEPPLDFVYLPFRQHPRSVMTLLTGTDAANAAPIAPVIRDAVRKIDPDMPAFDLRTMRDFYNQRAIKTSTILVQVVAGLGFMGLILAVVGLYGLVAYSVSRRTREIGIRMAIGADSRTVVWMVLQQGLQLGLSGVAVGLVLSIFACRVATSTFVTIDRIDPLIFVVLPLTLLIVTLLATYAPARRASLIDPMCALRDE